MSPFSALNLQKICFVRSIISIIIFFCQDSIHENKIFSNMLKHLIKLRVETEVNILVKSTIQLYSNEADVSISTSVISDLIIRRNFNLL